MNKLAATATAVMVLSVISFLISLGPVAPENRPLPPAVHQLRAISQGLFQYHQATGTFPHDPRGFRHALYKLHPNVHETAFSLNPDSDSSPPQFDHSSQQLLGGDIVYLNQPLSDLSGPEMVVLYAVGCPDRTWVLTSHGSPTIREFTLPPTNSLLGSFVTLDGFLVADRGTYDRWTETHFAPFSCTSDSHQVTSTKASTHTNTFHYESGHLSSCTVDTSYGTITETVTTDELGQITSLSRSPLNTKDIIESLWSEVANAAR